MRWPAERLSPQMRIVQAPADTGLLSWGVSGGFGRFIELSDRLPAWSGGAAKGLQLDWHLTQSTTLGFVECVGE